MVADFYFIFYLTWFMSNN